MQKRWESRSDAQLYAEEVALRRFGEQLGVNFVSRVVGDCHLDGYAEVGNTIILVECWAHIGPARPAQRNKVRSDVLKLTLVQRLLKQERPDCTVKSYMLFIDREASQTLLNNSWGADAAQEFDVSVEIVSIEPEVIEAVRAAQQRQDLRNG
ncbi:MAG: hypothetical protein HC884_10480 [Chloroflexaceae bacterium]|nr:hypothetical protein [Chloroflexaceae bacterium]